MWLYFFLYFIFCSSSYLCLTIILLDQHIDYMTFINHVSLPNFSSFLSKWRQNVFCVYCNIEVDEQYFHYIWTIIRMSETKPLRINTYMVNYILVNRSFIALVEVMLYILWTLVVDYNWKWVLLYVYDIICTWPWHLMHKKEKSFIFLVNELFW